MNATSLVLALLLFSNWLATVVSFRMSLDTFKDFKIEMPFLTAAVLTLFHPVFLMPITAFVLVVSVLVALRTRLGWRLSFVVCLLNDFVFLGFFIPLVALVNGLGGGDDGASANPALSFSFGHTATIVTIGAMLMTQLLFVALLLNRRHFSAPINSSP